jgi:hypothetical protein
MAERIEKLTASADQDTSNVVSRTPKELRAELEECLSDIQSSGSFAVFGRLNNPPNPGLYLKKGGPISLPLSDRDAEVIIAASHAAPFGKGEETIVDTSIRKTWEISLLISRSEIRSGNSFSAP